MVHPQGGLGNLSQRDHFVVGDRWNLKAHRAVGLCERQRPACSQGSHVRDCLAGSDVELDLLQTDGREAPDEGAGRIGISMVQDVQRGTWSGWPDDYVAGAL